jgi:hypothetical protein
MTVIAVRNGAVQPRQGDILQFLDDKSSGFGMVHFDKARRKIRIECWPLLADFTQPAAQWPGWPVEIDELQNYGRKPTGHLPTLNISGVAHPVIEVTDEATGELLYVLRSPKNTFRPHVFGPGKFTVRVSEPETGKSASLRGLSAAAESAALNVKL